MSASLAAGLGLEPDDTFVHAERLSIGYGATRLLSDLDWRIGPGTEVALTGRSGSGKTTLLLVLAGLLQPSAGRLTWPALAANAGQRRAQIGMVFQAPSLLPELTAVENVQLPLRLRGQSTDRAKALARDALGAVDLSGALHALPYQLSGGQQQRVAVARVIAGRPRLVLADEPTGALDRDNARRTLALLRDQIREQNGALVVATHDVELAALLDQRAEVRDGRLALADPAGLSR